MKAGDSLLRLLSVVLALSVVGLSQAGAAIILSENFETPAVGANVTTANSIFNGSVSAGTGGALQVTDDATAGIAFTGSKFLRYVDAATNAATMRSRFTLAPLSQAAITGVFQLSWDYYEPNAIIAGTATHFRFLLSQGDISANANRAVDFLLTAPNDGVATTGSTTNWHDGLTNLAAYATNSLVHFDIVGNVGASTTYAGGDLPTQTIDVYFNSVLVGDNLPFRRPNDPTPGSNTPITQIDEFGIGYSSSATRVQNVFVDNIALSDSIVVPEPGAILLSGLGLIVLSLIHCYRGRV
jgi:hypothetical protein